MDTEKEPAQKRKPRRSYNCGPCKKQKIKCDTQTPCSSCVRHNRVSQCLEQPPNPPSPDHRKRVRKESLSRFVEQDAPSNTNTSHIFTVTSLPPVPTATTSVSPSTEIKLPSIRNYTSTFSVNAGEFNSLDPLSRDAEVAQLRSQVTLLTERLTQLEAKVLGKKNGQLMSPPHQHRPLNRIAPDNIHDFQDCWKSVKKIRPLGKVIEFYKLFLNQPLNILEDKVIDVALKTLDELSHEELLHPSTQDWEYLSLMAMIISLALLQYPLKYILTDFEVEKNTVVTTADTFFQISKSALNSVKYRERPNIIHLRILLLFDIYLRYFNKRNLILALDSELVSMSYVMGLQTSSIPKNSLEVDTAQNVWWIISHLDTLKSLKYRTPPLIRLDTLAKPREAGISDSHILKAFISAENTTYQTIITHIAKITKICNEIPPSIKHSILEYIEALMMCDREITSYQVPDFFQNSKDINVIFQDCYLQFFMILTRFKIYQKILLLVDKIPNFKLKHSIWFLLLSIIESFLKRYSLLRSSFPVKDYFNRYIQVSEFLITGTIINLILVTSPNFKLQPKGYQNIVSNYTKILFEDLSSFHETIFNETIPFYSQSFKLMKALSQQFCIPELDFSMKQKQLELNNELQSSNVLKSLESKIGLIPSDEFCNLFFTEITNYSRGNKDATITDHSSGKWDHLSFLSDKQLEFIDCLGI